MKNEVREAGIDDGMTDEEDDFARARKRRAARLAEEAPARPPSALPYTVSSLAHRASAPPVASSSKVKIEDSGPLDSEDEELLSDIARARLRAAKGGHHSATSARFGG